MTISLKNMASRYKKCVIKLISEEAMLPIDEWRRIVNRRKNW